MAEPHRRVDDDDLVHHLATHADWYARTGDVYVPARFAEDGFVHAAFADQVVAAAERHFVGHDDLVLLTIDPTRLRAPVVEEDTSGHGAHPHVHGELDLDAIVCARPFPRDDEGGFGWWQGERRGQVAHRVTRATAAVTDLLDHFAGVDFDGAPKHRGTEAGLWFTDFVPGDVVRLPVPEWLPTEDALRSLGRLLRHAHDASRDFMTRHAFYAGNPEGEVVTHHDVGPGNVVWRDGLAVALIDWEFAEPGDPVVDLADAAVHVAGWLPEERRRRAGFPADATAERLVLALLDGYGGDHDLAGLADVVVVHLREELRRIEELGRFGGIEPWASLDGHGVGERLRTILAWHEDGRPPAAV